MKTFLIVGLIILAVVVVVLTVIYILGRKAEKKQAEQQEAMASAAQTMSLYIIDKKRMKLKDAGLPKLVLEQTPKLLRGTKLPIVKVKVGPKIMTMICEEAVFKTILPKQEVKATVSGLYITAAKRIRGPVYEPPKKMTKAEKKAAKQQEKNKKNK